MNKKSDAAATAEEARQVKSFRGYLVGTKDGGVMLQPPPSSSHRHRDRPSAPRDKH